MRKKGRKDTSLKTNIIHLTDLVKENIKTKSSAVLSKLGYDKCNNVL